MLESPYRETLEAKEGNSFSPTDYTRPDFFNVDRLRVLEDTIIDMIVLKGYRNFIFELEYNLDPDNHNDVFEYRSYEAMKNLPNLGFDYAEEIYPGDDRAFSVIRMKD